MRAADVMQKGVLSVSPELPARDFEEFLTGEEISGAPVIDDRGVLVGVATKTDLIREASEGVGPGISPIDADLTVEDIMTREVVCVSPNETVQKIAALMIETHVHRVLVGDGDEIVGIVTAFDLLSLLLD